MRAALCLVTSAGIALTAAARAEPPAPAPAMLPTPYTAEQIREAWQPGFSVEMRTREAGVDSSQRMTVLSATAEAATIRVETLDASGAPSAPASESSAKWSELREHALFEASRATRERAECRSPLGAMPGWRYQTHAANGDALAMCFADATPGPPVEYETTRAGKSVSRTEHTRYGRLTSGGAKTP
jgi:hypothetical protein